MKTRRDDQKPAGTIHKPGATHLYRDKRTHTFTSLCLRWASYLNQGLWPHSHHRRVLRLKYTRKYAYVKPYTQHEPTKVGGVRLSGRPPVAALWKGALSLSQNTLVLSFPSGLSTSDLRETADMSFIGAAPTTCHHKQPVQRPGRESAISAKPLKNLPSLCPLNNATPGFFFGPAAKA